MELLWLEFCWVGRRRVNRAIWMIRKECALIGWGAKEEKKIEYIFTLRHSLALPYFTFPFQNFIIGLGEFLNCEGISQAGMANIDFILYASWRVITEKEFNGKACFGQSSVPPLNPKERIAKRVHSLHCLLHLRLNKRRMDYMGNSYVIDAMLFNYIGKYL